MFIASLLVLVPTATHAATLSVAPKEVHLTAGDTASFTIVLESANEINTVGTAVHVPSGLSFVSAEAGSVIGQWVEPAAYNDADHEVEFSGIMPDGWRGKQTLITLRFKATQNGAYTLQFDADKTELYKNDGNATPEPVTFGTIARSIPSPALMEALLIVLALLFFWFIKRHLRVQFI